MDSPEYSLARRSPTPEQPLRGLTVLMVEDSRFSSEAMRIMCQRSGARLRRADTLLHAQQHLRTYRPDVVIVDLGLPDGSGESLIADLVRAAPRIDVIIGTSGDADGEDRAIAAGADAYLAKPAPSLAAFQALLLGQLPGGMRPRSPRSADFAPIVPDPLAYRDDLSRANGVLSGQIAGSVDYITQFLGTIAREAEDGPLAEAVARIRNGRSDSGPVSRLAALVQERLAQRRAGLH